MSQILTPALTLFAASGFTGPTGSTGSTGVCLEGFNVFASADTTNQTACRWFKSSSMIRIRFVDKVKGLACNLCNMLCMCLVRACFEASHSLQVPLERPGPLAGQVWQASVLDPPLNSWCRSHAKLDSSSTLTKKWSWVFCWTRFDRPHRRHRGHWNHRSNRQDRCEKTMSTSPAQSMRLPSKRFKL